ncbi:hypothetical protein D3C83_14100 [compost metagenome]
MVRVRFQRDGFVAAPGFEQAARDHVIDERGGGRDDQPGTDMVERLRPDQALDSGERDDACCDQNQRAFQPAGEVLGLAVAIGVLVVGRQRGDGQHGEHGRGPQQIHGALERVGEQADRAGEPPRQRFQPDGRHGGGDG